MRATALAAVVIVLCGTAVCIGQLPAADAEQEAPAAPPGERWRTSPRGAAPEAEAAAETPVVIKRRRRISPIGAANAAAENAAAADAAGEGESPAGDAGQIAPRPRALLARARGENGSLPAGDGQAWREYDISRYTARVANVSRPEQTIVDWVLRETGYEVWHSEPMGFMSANAETLTVYHTPEMQEIVAEVVDRFVNPQTETHAFSLRVITIDNPNWRARAQRMLQPVSVETQGVQAWLMATEDAALLLAELRKRNDYREHSSPNLLVSNGQTTVVSAMRTRSYVRDIVLRPGGWPGFESEIGQIDEGFSLELSPLLSADSATIDGILKCSIDQVERLLPVSLDVPTPAAPRQRTQIEVPQISHCRVHERFRWPAGQVLLVGLGVVATPIPVDPAPLRLPLPDTPARADLLVVIENRGQATATSTANTRATGGEAKSYHGRY